MAGQILAAIDEPVSRAVEQFHNGHSVILEREGSALAALITIRDLHLLESYLDELEVRVDRREFEKALEEVDREGAISLQHVKDEAHEENPLSCTGVAEKTGCST